MGDPGGEASDGFQFFRFDQLELHAAEVLKGLPQPLFLFLELTVGAEKIFLGEFAFGDIAADADQAPDLLSLAPEGDLGGEAPGFFSVGQGGFFLDINQGLALSKEVKIVFVKAFGDVFGEEVVGGFAIEVFFGGEAGGLKVSGVADEVMTFFVFDEDFVGQVVDDGFEEVVFLLKFFLHVDDLGDVARDAHGSDDLFIGVANGDFGGIDPTDAAIGEGFFFDFGKKGLAALEDFFFVVEGRLGVFLGKEVEVGPPDRVIGVGKAEGLGEGAIDADEAAAVVFKINAVRDVVGKEMKEFDLLAEVSVPILAGMQEVNRLLQDGGRGEGVFEPVLDPTGGRFKDPGRRGFPADEEEGSAKVDGSEALQKIGLKFFRQGAEEENAGGRIFGRQAQVWGEGFFGIVAGGQGAGAAAREAFAHPFATFAEDLLIAADEEEEALRGDQDLAFQQFPREVGELVGGESGHGEGAFKLN